MFTGLIEEIGKIVNIANRGSGKRITVQSKKINDDLKIDDSVAIDGVCQTVVEVNHDYFVVEAVEETIRKTTFSNLRTGQTVNLERAAKLGSRLGGHIVQGHTDCTGSIKSIEKQTLGILVHIEFPVSYDKYTVLHGSVTVDGISLTIARLQKGLLTVSIIPHSWEMTNLKNKSVGSAVNLEFDIIGKYIEKLLMENKTSQNQESSLSQYIDQPGY